MALGTTWVLDRGCAGLENSNLLLGLMRRARAPNC